VQKTPAVHAADGAAAQAQGDISALALPAGWAVIAAINPILRGWVNYFRVGNAARCFGYVKEWVEKKVRRHLMPARAVGASVQRIFHSSDAANMGDHSGTAFFQRGILHLLTARDCGYAIKVGYWSWLPLKAIAAACRRWHPVAPGVTGHEAGAESARAQALRRRLRHEALSAERRALVALRDQGVISDDALHRLEQELDIEAIRIGLGEARRTGA
jgi:hypothetical protein